MGGGRNRSKGTVAGASDAYERWRVPDIGKGAAGEGPRLEPPRLTPYAPTGAERVHRQAYEEGLARGRQDGERAGREEGLAMGRAELAARIERFRQLMLAMARPLEELDDEVERSLVEVAIGVARQLVRRELRTDRGQVVAAVREAVKALPAGTRTVRVQLHPEDVPLVREALGLDADSDAPWEIVEDPVLTRGGCRVTSEASRINATVEDRLAAVIAEVFGGERRDDGPA